MSANNKANQKHTWTRFLPIPLVIFAAVIIACGGSNSLNGGETASTTTSLTSGTNTTGTLSGATTGSTTSTTAGTSTDGGTTTSNTNGSTASSTTSAGSTTGSATTSAGGTTGNSSSSGSSAGSSGSNGGTTGSLPTITNVATNTYIQRDQWSGPNTPYALDATVAADQKIGYTAIRIALHWDSFEMSLNQVYDFTVYENAVKSIVKFGLQPVIVVLTTNPIAPSSLWINSDGTINGSGFPTTQTDMNTFASFIAALSQDLSSLAPSGLVLEIGFEVNHASNDITKADDYAALLNLCRAVTPSSVKLAGPGVSSWHDGSSQFVSSTVYATECFKAGMKPDIFTAHLYDGTGTPSALMSTGEQLAGLAGSTPFWVTECGYPSGPVGNSNAVDPATQSSNIMYEVQNFTKFAAKVFVYEDRDETWIQNDPVSPQEGFFGTSFSPGAPKSSGQALEIYLHSTASPGVKKTSIPFCQETRGEQGLKDEVSDTYRL